MSTYEQWGERLHEDPFVSVAADNEYLDWTADREVLKRGWIEDEHRLAGFIGYQRRHRKWALRRVRRWFYWRKRADDMGDAWLTQKSRAEAAEDDRDKLAERVRVLEEALDAALLYRLAHETGAKIGAQDKTKADADIDKALIARAATEEEKR